MFKWRTGILWLIHAVSGRNQHNKVNYSSIYNKIKKNKTEIYKLVLKDVQLSKSHPQCKLLLA